MSPSTRSYNLAARMGRWSASHWKTSGSAGSRSASRRLRFGMQVVAKQIDMQDVNVGQSHQADQILKEGFPQVQADPQEELVLVHPLERRDTGYPLQSHFQRQRSRSSSEGLRARSLTTTINKS